MNDWSSFMSTLDGHRKAVENILTNYPPVKKLDEITARQVEAHLDAIVGCCNQVDAWVANNGEALEFCAECEWQGACNVNGECRLAWMKSVRRPSSPR